MIKAIKENLSVKNEYQELVEKYAKMFVDEDETSRYESMYDSLLDNIEDLRVMVMNSFVESPYMLWDIVAGRQYPTVRIFDGFYKDVEREIDTYLSNI